MYNLGLTNEVVHAPGRGAHNAMGVDLGSIKNVEWVHGDKLWRTIDVD